MDETQAMIAFVTIMHETYVESCFWISWIGTTDYQILAIPRYGHARRRENLQSLSSPKGSSNTLSGLAPPRGMEKGK